MRVMMISGDRRILKEDGEARARLELQRMQVARLDAFVWPQIHSWREIMRAARENRYDVVTAQDPFWRGALAWWAARRAGAKLNLQVHTDLFAQSFWRRQLASFLLRRADSVRVVSEKIQEHVRAMRVNTHIHVLPIYIDINRFRGLEPKPHTPCLPAGRQKTILWVGRFEREKDPLSAVGVLKEVREKGVDAKLVMLGSGDLEPEARRAAKGLPVEFPGWQDPVAYLPAADAALCTSRSESWGASIVEALAAGVPVVALDVGVAREAGAIIASKPDLAKTVVAVLKSNQRGALKISLPSAEEWAKRWRETLA